MILVSSILRRALVLLALAAWAVPARAQEEDTGPKVPRFVSLNAGEINVRSGPGPQYPISWKYVRSGLPVEIVAEYEYWRKIRDHDGSIGWVHKSLLSGRRFALVEGRTRTIYDDPDPGSRPIARLEAGVVVKLRRCDGPWCEVDAGDYRGWLTRSDVWGVYPNEDIR